MLARQWSLGPVVGGWGRRFPGHKDRQLRKLIVPANKPLIHLNSPLKNSLFLKTELAPITKLTAPLVFRFLLNDPELALLTYRVPLEPLYTKTKCFHA